MSCKELLENACKKQKKGNVDCPIHIFPLCHPRAQVEVFVDGKRREITLVCGKCDRTISKIQIKKGQS